MDLRSEQMASEGGVPGKSAERAFDILEYLGRRTEPASSGSIGLACGIPKSTLYNLLNIMKERRILTRDDADRTWRLGPRLFELDPDAPLFTHGLSVLQAFSTAKGGLTLREITLNTKLSLPVVRRIIAVLEDAYLISLQPDGTYLLGLGLFSLATRVSGVDNLRTTVHQVLIQLRDATRETVDFAVLDQNRAICIHQVESRQTLRSRGWLGRQIPLKGTALGAALKKPLEAYVVDGAVEEGVVAIACGIEGASPPSAVSVLAPDWRVEQWGVEQAQRLVLSAARQIGDIVSGFRR